MQSDRDCRELLQPGQHRGLVLMLVEDERAFMSKAGVCVNNNRGGNSQGCGRMVHSPDGFNQNLKSRVSCTPKCVDEHSYP